MANMNYVILGSNKLEAAKPFYDALLKTIGFAPVADRPDGGRAYRNEAGQIFGIFRPYDQKAATVGNGSMIAFSLDTTEEVDAFHAKALALGAKDDGAPGDRNPGAYFAYVRDLDGNKICAYKLG